LIDKKRSVSMKRQAFSVTTATCILHAAFLASGCATPSDASGENDNGAAVQSGDTESTDPSPAGSGESEDPSLAKGLRIAEAAAKLKGASTSNGPGGGNVACVYAINKVLRAAGVSPPWGTSLHTSAVRGALDAGAGKTVAEPEPGAIVVFRDDGNPPYPHVGIVLADGRSIISNSSSRASFSWVSTEDGYRSYYGRSPEYWRLK